MVIYLKESNKMGKIGNVGIKVKHMSLLKIKRLFKKKLLSYINLIKKTKKHGNFFLSKKSA